MNIFLYCLCLPKAASTDIERLNRSAERYETMAKVALITIAVFVATFIATLL